MDSKEKLDYILGLLRNAEVCEDDKDCYNNTVDALENDLSDE